MQRLLQWKHWQVKYIFLFFLKSVFLFLSKWWITFNYFPHILLQVYFSKTQKATCFGGSKQQERQWLHIQRRDVQTIAQEVNSEQAKIAASARKYWIAFGMVFVAPAYAPRHFPLGDPILLHIENTSVLFLIKTKTHFHLLLFWFLMTDYKLTFCLSPRNHIFFSPRNIYSKRVAFNRCFSDGKAQAQNTTRNCKSEIYACHSYLNWCIFYILNGPK